MSTMAVIGLIVLIAVVAAGTLIKMYTKRTLKDMDGVGNAAVVPREKADHLIRKENIN
ncbi:MAG: hypothetical protein VB031_04100 [Eubacteriaceae bacterium]|nr:hypothetical protein [Eubacteriaceae bacterium]